MATLTATAPAVSLRQEIMNFSIECEQEIDGRWIAEIPQLPGVLYYGKTAEEAVARADALMVLTRKLGSPSCGRSSGQCF